MWEPVTTRFAPSPTGALHLGHAYSALFAAARGTRFVLRHEDIDRGRSRVEHMVGIEADLAWLGLAWERPVWRQSTRLGVYAGALERLRGEGLVYPCFCTRADIAASLSAPHGGIAPDPGAIYPGTCLRLDPATRARRMATEPHAWRLDTSVAVARTGPLTWHDARAGEQRARAELHGDIVLARKDAPASYHLAVTIDDAAQGVTLVTRGRDLFAVTHAQRLLQARLGLPTPAYHHHPMLVGPDGARLAKRAGSPTIAALRAGGRRSGAARGRADGIGMRVGWGHLGASETERLGGLVHEHCAVCRARTGGRRRRVCPRARRDRDGERQGHERAHVEQVHELPCRAPIPGDRAGDRDRARGAPLVVKLNRIYTKTGDDGTTGLVTGPRVLKSGARIAAIGDVDEANSILGVARLNTAGDEDAMLGSIQNDLFDLGADLATPGELGGALRVTDAQVDRLEVEIDKMNAELPPLTSFILPGGRPAAARVFLARAVVRRAERLAVALAADEMVTAAALRYMNRLSDHLFVLARHLNMGGGSEILWVPGGNRSA